MMSFHGMQSAPSTHLPNPVCCRQDKSSLYNLPIESSLETQCMPG